MKKIIVLIFSLFMSISVIKANDDTYLMLPSFSEETKIVGINSTKRFKDENGVLNDFEIEYSDIDASIVENDLEVNTKEEGIYRVGFIKKSMGETTDIKFNITIKVVSGSITVIAVDSEKKDRLEASLKNFNVDLYKGNVGIGQVYIDENNSGSRYNLTFGEYKVKNGKTPYGYKLKSIEERLYIWEGSYDINVYLNYEVIKGNLIINKYCGDEIDDEAEFEIYHNDILIKTIKGNSYEELEFGTYLVKQINGKKHYDFIEDFTVRIDQEKDYVYELESAVVEEVENIINNRDSELEKLQQEKLEYEKELLNKEDEIRKYKELLEKKEGKITEYEKQIDLLKKELIKNEEINKELELKLMNKNILKEKQEMLLENEENVLIVNVPDTYKKNNNKRISNIFIVVGLILIILNFIYKKKTIL